MSFIARTPAELTAFLQQQVPVLLAHLDPVQLPAWGLMTPQHMVEHLAGAVRLSVGRAGLAAPPDSPALAQARAFLLSEAPFPRNVRNPLVAPLPGPLRLPSLAAAASSLLLCLDDFFAHYAAQPAATAVHPMFGTLDFGQWQVFHVKHFGHHFRQFGLLPVSAGPQAEG